MFSVKKKYPSQFVSLLELRSCTYQHAVHNADLQGEKKIVTCICFQMIHTHSSINVIPMHAKA
jgi:hypothetical protein